MPGKFLLAVTVTIMNTVLHTQNIVEIRHAIFYHFTGIKKAVQKLGASQLNYIYQNPLSSAEILKINNFVYSQDFQEI